MTPSDPLPGPATSPADAPSTPVAGPRAAPDPSHALAPGYDVSTPAFQTALAASRADPELALVFQERLDGEAVRFRTWAEGRRAGGGDCGWSGPPDVFVPQSPEILLRRATEIAERRRRWRASPEGRLSAALAQAETDLEAVQAALEDARDAVDRADRTCVRRAMGVSAAALRLHEGALRLQAAAREADRFAGEAAERPDSLWRFTREMCAASAHPAPARDRHHEA